MQAARILRSFCIDGFDAEQSDSKAGTEKKHADGKNQRILDRIPPEVIRNAKGLAIFTTLRAGLTWSHASGSGVVVSKMPNGEWSPPSGILNHMVGYGFVAGADIYDCVAVINSDKGMEGFTRVRTTLGGEVSAAVGPLGGGGRVESEMLKRQAPVWTYTKSKGLYVGVQLNGTVIVERKGENERFYGVKGVRHQQILAGEVDPGASKGIVELKETLQAAEGVKHDERKMPKADEKSPGDYEVEKPQEDSEKEYNEFADPRDRADGSGRAAEGSAGAQHEHQQSTATDSVSRGERASAGYEAEEGREHLSGSAAS